MALELEHSSESPGGFVTTQTTGPSPEFRITRFEDSQRVCG